MLGCRDFGCVRVCRECAELPAFFCGWRDAVGGTAKVPEGGEKGGRQRERISARARTPSGDTTKVP